MPGQWFIHPLGGESFGRRAHTAGGDQRGGVSDLDPVFRRIRGRYLPLAVIAGLLCVVATGLINVLEIRHLWRDEPKDRAPLVATFLATLTISLEWAILLALAPLGNPGRELVML